MIVTGALRAPSRQGNNGLTRPGARIAPTKAPAPPGALPRRAPTPSGALLLLAVLLPLLLMTVGALVAWRAAWDAAAAEVTRSAESVAEHGQRILTLHAVAADAMDALLRGLSDAEIRAAEPTLHLELRHLLAGMPDARFGFVADRHGRILVSTRFPDLPASLRDISARDAFQALARADAPAVHVGRVEASRVDGTLFVPVSRRRSPADRDLPEGALDGIVSVSILPAQLTAGLRRFASGPGDVAALLRADGEVLAHSAGPPGPIRLHQAFRDALVTQPPAALASGPSVRDGRPYLAAFRRVEGWPVYAAAARPHAAIHAEWRAAVAGQLLVGVPAMLLLLATALAVRRAERRLAAAKGALEARVVARTADLAASKAQLSEALEAGRVFAFTYEPGTDRVTRSAQAAAILGLPPYRATEDRGSAYLAAVHPEDRPAMDAALGALAPGAELYAVRYRWRRPDGRLIWLEDNGRAAAFGPDGRLLRLTSLVRDVTAEAEAERALRATELRQRAAVEGAGLGTYEIDFARNAIWCDDRAAALWGGTVPPGRWVSLGGPEWARLDATIHPDDRRPFDEAWRAVVIGAAPGWSVETRLRRPDGSWAWDWCHGIVAAHDPATGRPLRLVGVVRDVTEQRRLEAELRQGQKLQALGQLAGGLAHDVNNVLQAVSGAAAALARDPGNRAGVERRARLLAEAVTRGAAITGRLLAFARRTDIRREPVQPRELLLGLAEMLQPMLGARIRIVVAAAPDLPPFLADREQVQTALINLATNARDAMPDGGRLTFAAALAPAPEGLGAGSYLRLDVSDTGTGMDAATLSRVTEPFFTTKPPGEGTGLGLPLARGLAEQSGGAFAIDSAPGRGTTVSLWFPRQPAAQDDAAAGAPRSGLPRGLRLLVVDDDPLVREALAAELEAEGCQVLARPDAAAALAVLEEGAAVDALVTDLAMPGQDGLALIGAARRLRPGLRCLLVTGQPEQEGPLPPCSDGGPCEVLRKPVSAAHIAAVLADMFEAT